MGNTDSHSSFSSSAKSSCSVTFSSRQEEVQSAHSWWSNRRGRSHPKQQAADSPYSSWHHELPPRGAGSPQRYVSGERRQSGGSPKVLLSKDGSMRVEFTNTRVIPMEPLDLPGLPASSTSAAPEPSLRTSEGSSLSSVGSWYDSPWGAGGETTDSVFVCRQSAANSGGCTTHSPARTEVTTTTTIGSSDYNAFFSAKVDVSPGFNSHLLFSSAETGGYNSCSSGRTEDSGIGDSVILQPDLRDFSLVSASTPSLDVYSTYSTLPAFPTPPDAALQQRGTSTCSSKGLLDDVFHEEEGSAGGVEQLYSSFTLPRRWTEPASSTSTSTSTSGNNRKDFLKSRIRRLSDWTGSLSRKKRKIQEPSSSEDVFSLDSVWTSNPLNQLPAAPSSSSSSSALNLSSDLQRRNVYDTFMQELETGCNRTEPSEEDEEEEEEETETDGEMEVLYEKEKGVVRRAGWLSFKPLLSVNKDRKLELVARRKWRRYWVTLKGGSLLLYETYGRTRSSEQEPAPRLAVVADDSVVQPVPEHPRRENVFCLSNSQGDVYLLQATNQTDLENWVTAIHSASASLLAKRQGKEDTLHLLRCQSRSLLHDIDLDAKMKKMAELQLSVIKEQKNRRAVENQIQQWEQNLEKLNLVLFRLRCYQSSLQGSELPNPKGLLAVASRPSKSMLGRLGVFSVSSFHALVCSRDETTLRRRTLAGGHRRGRGLSPTLKTLDRLNRRSRNDGPTTAQRLDCSSNHREVPPPAGRPAALQLQPSVLAVFTLNICQDGATEDFGFSVTGHVDGGGRSHVYVSEVDPLGVSAREGLTAGDEVLSVNGATMSGLDLDLMQNVFSHQNLKLLLRRDESLGLDGQFATVVRPDPSDPYQVPPPSDLQTWTSSIHKDSSPLRDAPVPACDVVSLKSSEDGEQQNQNAERVYSLYQTFPECRAVDVDVPRNPYCKEAGLQPPSPAHLSVCQRLRKVIQELVDTEKSYVKDLVCLFHVYLTPLQTETFLSQEEMEALFGSLPEMLDFQRVFLQTLEERIASCPNFGALETPGQFQTLLFSLGGSFLHYADHFKHYSGFCANHLKVQKVLERAKVDGAFKLFLEARNPTNQHSSSLESYLIKPVQRVLKYPLLLRELVSLTAPESPEHTHLTEALRAMEKVASHINEMQKIYEEFGSVFDQLVAEQSGPHRQVTEISMGEFLVHSSVLWLNPLPSLGRLRRDPELTLFVFKRAVVLLYRQSAKLKKRMTASRSADLDPFRFRWLIPVSAAQVRPANITGPENPCVWELVHSRSEVEGRPETVFQLCSSGLETKVSVLRVLRSVLRDRPPAGSLRRTRPSTAERRRQRCRSDSQRTGRHRSGQNRRPDGSFILGETSSEPLLASAADSTAKRTRLCSLTSELEAQLQRLNVTEERAGPGTAAKRRSPAGDEFDLLDRDFSVQSATSMINEECFYDSQMAKANVLKLTC